LFVTELRRGEDGQFFPYKLQAPLLDLVLLAFLSGHRERVRFFVFEEPLGSLPLLHFRHRGLETELLSN
jgi:hypothetical protein